MTQIQSVQGGTTLSSLLATQLSSKSTGSQSSTASSTSPTSSDTVTLSLAALQALLGQGTDPTQLLQSQTQATYTAKGHHHHHHGAAAQQTGNSTQGTSTTSTPVAAASDAGTAGLQTKA